MRAPPDGYTLLLVDSTASINATLYEKLNYNFIRDIAPVAGIVRLPLVMVVHPSVPAKTIPEFITYAKANPGKLTMASGGSGTSVHVSGELFKMMTGVQMVHVPYRGAAPAVADLFGGQVQVVFDNLPGSIEYIRAGRLRALGVTTTVRSAALPDVPTVAEFVPGYEASAWFGIGTPKGTPAEIIDRLKCPCHCHAQAHRRSPTNAGLNAILWEKNDTRHVICANHRACFVVVRYVGVALCNPHSSGNEGQDRLRSSTPE